jgi:hypothetical protein
MLGGEGKESCWSKRESESHSVNGKFIQAEKTESIS